MNESVNDLLNKILPVLGEIDYNIKIENVVGAQKEIIHVIELFAKLSSSLEYDLIQKHIYKR